MTSKHQATWDWLYSCEDVQELFFAFSGNQNGQTVIIPTATEKVDKQYIDGTSMRRYDFSIAIYTAINPDVPNNDENVDVMENVENIMEWVDAQQKAQNYPDFPSNCSIMRVENLQNMPTVAGQDEQGGKFLFACRIVYRQTQGD